MKKGGNRLTHFYSVFSWIDDPESERGKEYFEATVRSMEKLLEHPWIEKLGGREGLEVLELCGGAGFGGVVLAKLLQSRGTKVGLTVTDLRPEALEQARRLGARELGAEPETMVLDAREGHRLKRKFDIALLYGLSTPHFDPWELVELLASVAEALKDEGSSSSRKPTGGTGSSS